MIKMTAIGFLNGVAPTEADRWYFRYHSKECIRFFGPWLRRYESYRAYPFLREAEPWHPLGGRLTELWWDSVESFQESMPFSWPFTPSAFTKASNAPQGSGVVVPAMPTEDFLGKNPLPEAQTILRWVWAFGYPEGVDEAEGEKWYLETHAKETCRQEGLLRFVSHRAVEPPILPGKIRISELWYEDMDAWYKAVVESPPDYTPPPWSKTAPFLDMQSTFVGYKPDVDFLKDSPFIP